jgi:serine phosphatase RsbU (regulator of sigma subunit)
MTNVTSYAARLGQSKEQRDAKQLVLSVKQAQVQLMKELLDAENRASEALEHLESLKSQPKLNFRAILEAKLNFDSEAEIADELMALQLELFPENTKEIITEAAGKAVAAKPATKRATSKK